jgi:hypothetical protein
VLPESARGRVEEWANRDLHPINIEAHYVPENLDYKEVKFNPNFSSGNKGYLSMLPDLPAGYVFGS